MNNHLPPRIALASGNSGKVREFQDLFNDLGIELISLKVLGITEGAEENGDTFEANALLKAHHVAELSNLPSLADDSGLSVDALQGRPGIYSARYGSYEGTSTQLRDESNNQKLLTELNGIADEQRGAHYSCALALVYPYKHKPTMADIVCTGHWHGFILSEPRGHNGFGYDPLFLIPKQNCSAAELAANQKHLISHRASAWKQLLAHFQLNHT